MPAGDGASGGGPPDAHAVTGEQVREWAFHGWCALIDADKYPAELLAAMATYVTGMLFREP